MQEHEKLDKNSLNYLVPEPILQRCKREGEARGEARGEAKGEVKGEAKGEAKGQRQTVKLQLEAQFGPLPANLLRALERANGSQRERLAIALLDASSLEGALSAAGLRPWGNGYGAAHARRIQDAGQEAQSSREPDDRRDNIEAPEPVRKLV